MTTLINSFDDQLTKCWANERAARYAPCAGARYLALAATHDVYADQAQVQLDAITDTVAHNDEFLWKREEVRTHRNAATMYRNHAATVEGLPNPLIRAFRVSKSKR